MGRHAVRVLAVLAVAALAVGARELLTVREAPPLYEAGTRRVLRVWLIEGWMGSSEWVLAQAAAFEQANDGVHVRVRRALAQELTAAEAVLPDVLLFEPGAIDAPAELLTPVAGETGVRPEIEAAGRYRDVRYAVPVCMGGYLALCNDALFAGAWTAQDLAASQGVLQIPQDGARCYSAAALSMGAASQGLLGALPDGALAADALACTPEKAYRDFAQGRAAVLVCTQREARRMAALREAGEGFAFSALAPERAYTDLLLLGGVTRGAPQGALGSAFLSQLVDEPAQAQLAAHGLYPVIAGDNPFPQATAPLLRAAFEPLRDASLLCANAFSWAEQAPLLSAHARAGLLQGGAALEDAGFY